MLPRILSTVALFLVVSFTVNAQQGKPKVDFQSVTIELEDNVPLVLWETSEEVSISHFELQRSFDGKKFETVDIVVAKSEGETTFYGIQDKGMDRLSATYRIKTVDLNDVATYSKKYPFSIQVSKL